MDDIRDVAIDATVQRQYLSTHQDAGVRESNAALYLEASTEWSGTLHTIVGVRDDQFWFNVKDKMRNADGSCDIRSDPLGCNTGSVRANLASPKLGVILGPWAGTSWFITLAEGYHSNDARGITRSGASPDAPPVTPLTRAVSGELGLSATPVPRWQSTLDAFVLKLRSELVFDGDAGETSPSGATTRFGIESGNTFRINTWLHAELNVALSKARFDHNTDPDDLGCGDAAPSHPCTSPIAISGRYIPNSPTNVIDAGLTAQHPSGWFGALKVRHFGESPLTEDDSAKSPAYTTADLQLGYQHAGKWLIAADVFNLFDAKWNDIEYYYVSRLQHEASPSADFVVHPGVPRTVRIHVQYFL
jgi:outer membrane receptor protein involved in Fe transport